MINEKIRKESQIYSLLYFELADIMESLINNVECNFIMCGIGLKRDAKFTHNEIMRGITATKRGIERLNEQYTDRQCMQDWDALRTDSVILKRLILLLVDRLGEDIDGKNLKRIENYLRKLPTNDFIQEETINKCIMK